MRKFDITETILKSAAISGIALAWTNFTLKAFKMAWHIISTSPEEFTLNAVTIDRTSNCECAGLAVCEECENRFVNDGYDPENDRFLCENCREAEKQFQ